MGSARPCPHSPLPGDRTGQALPLFQSKQTSGGCAASPGCRSPPERNGGAGPPACTRHRCPRLTNPGRAEPGATEMLHGPPGLREPRGGFPAPAKGTAAPWPGPLPAMGFLGNACLLPHSQSHPWSFPAVGAGVGASLTSPSQHLAGETLRWEKSLGTAKPKAAGESTPANYRQGKEVGREMLCRGRRVGRGTVLLPAPPLTHRQPWESHLAP